MTKDPQEAEALRKQNAIIAQKSFHERMKKAGYRKIGGLLIKKELVARLDNEAGQYGMARYQLLEHILTNWLEAVDERDSERVVQTTLNRA